ncbi:hypothetical protein [Halobellus captivus]|nr:hypothetical protein [Halobellus captivus]
MNPDPFDVGRDSSAGAVTDPGEGARFDLPAVDDLCDDAAAPRST